MDQKRAETKSSARRFTDRASRKGWGAHREFSDLARRTRIKKRRKQRGAQRNFAAKFTLFKILLAELAREILKLLAVFFEIYEADRRASAAE